MSERNGRTERRFGPMALLLAVAVAAASGPAFADKLVVFKNGKTLRAKSVKEEKGWSRLELEGGSFVGVRASLVQGVEETSSGTTTKSESLPNQASVGGGGGGGGGGYAPQPYQPQQEAAEAGDDFQQAPAEVSPPPQSSPGVAINPNSTGPRSQPFGAGRGNRFNQNRNNNNPNMPGVSFPGNVRQPVNNNQGGLRGNLRNNNLGQNNNNTNANQDDDE